MTNNLKEMIRDRLALVKTRIENAALTAKRDPKDIKLIAVSKRMPSEMIRAAYELGQRDFGENYAQEFATKAEELADLKDIKWHFIGPLQRNKTKLMLPHLPCLHTLAKRDLAKTLNRRISETQSPMDVLIQVNVSGELSKSGIELSELKSFYEDVSAYPNLRCVGLMTMPPPSSDPKHVAPYFAALAQAKAEYPSLRELSMGMSGDLEVAIANGATMIRIGTAIFGPRPPLCPPKHMSKGKLILR